jgi:hypothetical protein
MEINNIPGPCFQNVRPGCYSGPKFCYLGLFWEKAQKERKEEGTVSTEPALIVPNSKREGGQVRRKPAFPRTNI